MQKFSIFQSLLQQYKNNQFRLLTILIFLPTPAELLSSVQITVNGAEPVLGLSQFYTPHTSMMEENDSQEGDFPQSAYSMWEYTWLHLQLFPPFEVVGATHFQSDADASAHFLDLLRPIRAKMLSNSLWWNHLFISLLSYSNFNVMTENRLVRSDLQPETK